MNESDQDTSEPKLRSYTTELTYGGYRPLVFTHFCAGERGENFLTWVLISDFPDDGGFVKELIGRGEWPIPVDGLNWEASLTDMALDESARKFARAFEVAAEMPQYHLEKSKQFPRFVGASNPKKELLHRILFGSDQTVENLAQFQARIADDDLNSFIDKVMRARHRKQVTVRAYPE